MGQVLAQSSTGRKDAGEYPGDADLASSEPRCPQMIGATGFEPATRETPSLMR